MMYPVEFNGLRHSPALVRAVFVCTSMVLLAAVPVFAGTKISRSTRDPAFVDITMNSPAEWLDHNSSRRSELKAELVQQVRHVADTKPGRVIVLRVEEGRIKYERLTNGQRAQVANLAGNDIEPKTWYERKLNNVLMDVLAKAREGRSPLMLSVYGLPEESSTDRTNECFADVIADIEAFVLPRTFLLSGSVTAQESMLRSAMPDTYRLSDGRPIFFRSNRDWKMTIGLESPLRGSSSATAMSSGQVSPPPATAVADPMRTLQMSWGKTDSTMDVNADGIADLDDLLMLVNHWQFYSEGGTGPAPGSNSGGDGEVPTGGSTGGNNGTVARFSNAPSQYTIGSGGTIKLEMLAQAPAQPNVVFQVWSDASNAIESAVTDWDAPFKYPASLLNNVTPGGAEVQALVRDQNMQVVAIIRHAAAFVLPDPPPSPPSGGNGSGAGNGSGSGSGSGSGGSSGGGNGGSSGGGNGGGSGGGADLPAPIPSIKTLIDNGMAPFTVNVHALNSTLSVGDPLTARYEWNFGDEESQFNTLVGWNAAHLYESPGNYTVTLKVTDQNGKSGTATTTVAVAADTRTKIYVSDTGSDSNSGQSASAPIRSIARVNQLMGNNRAFLFQKSGTYQLNTTLMVGNRSNVVIGSYGNGAKPMFWWTTSDPYANMISISSQSKNVVVQDIKFDSPYSPSNMMVRGVSVHGTNMTVRNCNFARVSYAMTSGGEGVRGWLSMGNVTGAIGAYYAWCEGSDHVHIGNTVGGGVDEHNIRMCAERVLIAHNDLTNTSKSTIWCNIGKYCYVSNNKLRKGRFLVGPNFANTNQSESFQWVVFEGNEMFNEGVILYSGAQNIMLRNNVIDFDGGECFSIWGHEDTYDHNCKNVFVYHNTAFNRHPSYGRFSKIGKDAEDIVFANNLYCATSLNAQNGALNIFSDDNNLNTLKFSSNMWAAPTIGASVHGLSVGQQSSSQWAAFGQTSGEKYHQFNANDLDSAYVPQFNANSGEAVPGVHCDMVGKPRALTGTVTAGAVQKD